MIENEQYIKDLERSLEKQEELFNKQIQEVLSGEIFSEYSSFPIESLCLVQPFKDKKGGLVYCPVSYNQE